jgi:hypothetical protein
MKLASVIALFTFGALPGLHAAPSYLTATDIFFDCGGQGACGFFDISGPGFEGLMLGDVSASTLPAGSMELGLDGNPEGSILTVGNTTYEAGSILATGPLITAYMTSTTFDYDEAPYVQVSASGPANATGEISVCFVSVLIGSDGTCDSGLAFAIINLPGLTGTFSESWSYGVEGPGNSIFDDRSGSLSGTIAPEPLTAGIAFAGLLLLVAYSKCQSQDHRAWRDRFPTWSRLGHAITIRDIYCLAGWSEKAKI